MLTLGFRKFKIPSYQHGHVYLTTHRICYVDNAEPRKNSTAIELKNVDKYEFYVLQHTLYIDRAANNDIGWLYAVIS